MSGWLLLVAALAGAAAAALWARPTMRPVRWSPRRLRIGSRVLPALGALLVAAVAAGLEGRHLGLVVVAGVAVLGVVRLADRARQDKTAHRRRLQVVDFCEALVGELRAGQPVGRAVERSVAAWPEAEAVAAAARLDASVPTALRRLATLPGAGAVRRLAGAWEISVGTGSGLLLAVEQILATVRAEEATARLVRAELASARATARLVTTLPLIVLLAAQGIGARPWHFLLDTAAGVACLGAGVTLGLLGLGWIDRIAATSTEVPG